MKQVYKNVLLWAVILVMFVAFYQFFDAHATRPRDLSYGEFLTYVDQGQVRSLRIKGQTYVGHIKSNGAEFAVTGEVPSEALLDRLHSHGVDFQIERDDRSDFWIPFLSVGLPVLFMAVLFVAFFRARPGATKPLVAPVAFRTLTAQDNELRLADVGGLGPARAELETLVGQLKDKSKVIQLGGEAPKTLLLTGPPGTGKTLLALALSGELGRSLHWMAGSEFFETFVGVGALRVREFFAMDPIEPRVLFIDELDAVGRGRTQKSERDETLNS